MEEAGKTLPQNAVSSLRGHAVYIYVNDPRRGGGRMAVVLRYDGLLC